MQQKQRFKVLKKKTQILQLLLYFLLDGEIFKATEKLGSWNLQGYVSPQNTYVTCDLFQQLESNVIRVNISMAHLGSNELAKSAPHDMGIDPQVFVQVPWVVFPDYFAGDARKSY